MGGMQPEMVQKLINEQRETRKAILSRPQNNIKITQEGWEYSTQKATAKKVYIDKYFRT